MTYIENVARRVAALAEGAKIVVEKSTVPVRAAESIATILRANANEGVKYTVRSRCLSIESSDNSLIPKLTLLSPTHTYRSYRIPNF